MKPETSEDDHLLQWAMEEIRILRRRNELLQTKVDTMDTLAAFLAAKVPEQSQVMAEDVVWRLQKRIEERKHGPEKPECPVAPNSVNEVA